MRVEISGRHSVSSSAREISASFPLPGESRAHGRYRVAHHFALVRWKKTTKCCRRFPCGPPSRRFSCSPTLIKALRGAVSDTIQRALIWGSSVEPPVNMFLQSGKYCPRKRYYNEQKITLLTGEVNMARNLLYKGKHETEASPERKTGCIKCSAFNSQLRQ